MKYLNKTKVWILKTYSDFKYYIMRVRVLLLYINNRIHINEKNDDWVKLVKINFFKNKAIYYHGRFGYVDSVGRDIRYKEATILDMYEKFIAYKHKGSVDVTYDDGFFIPTVVWIDKSLNITVN